MTVTLLGVVFLVLAIGLTVSAYIMSRAKGHRLVDLAYTAREYMFALAMFTAALVRFDLLQDADYLRLVIYTGITVTTTMGIAATAKARWVHRWLVRNHPEVFNSGYTNSGATTRRPDQRL